MIVFYLLFYVFMSLSFIAFVFIYFTCVEMKFYILDYSFFVFESMDIFISFYFDYLSNLFFFIVSLISMATFFYSNFYMSEDKNQNKFLFLTFCFVFSMNIVILSLNFFVIFVGWDCLGIISYFLVVHYNSDNSDYSGMVTIMTNRIGDIAMIFCIYLTFSLFSCDIFLLNLDHYLLLFMLFISFSAFTKSAQFPFSVWLPLAMAAPTPISALVHSSTLVTAGVYLFIRFSNLFKINMNYLNFLVILVGLTMLISSCGALSELDMKKIIAYSTLSQLSLMMMSVIMGSDMFSFFHILTHALFKALLFMCSGVFIHMCFDNQDIRFYNLNMKLDLFVVSVFFICSLSLMGFPFLSGFYSKDLILEMVYTYNYNMFFVFLLVASTVITGLYSFRLIYYSMILGKKNMKLLFVLDWSSINNTMFYLFLGVIFSGSMIYWLMMLKFEVMFLSVMLKLLNLLIFIVFFFIFKLLYLNSWSSLLIFNKNYFLTMFFLKNYQGFFFNNVFKNMTIYFVYFEYMNEYLTFKKFMFFYKNICNLLIMIKLFWFYFLFLLLFLFFNFDFS